MYVANAMQHFFSARGDSGLESCGGESCLATVLRRTVSATKSRRVVPPRGPRSSAERPDSLLVSPVDGRRETKFWDILGQSFVRVIKNIQKHTEANRVTGQSFGPSFGSVRGSQNPENCLCEKNLRVWNARTHFDLVLLWMIQSNPLR